MSELRSRWVTSIETPAVEGYVCDPAVAMAWIRDLCSCQLEGCTIQVSCTVEMHPWIKLHGHHDGSTGQT